MNADLDPMGLVNEVDWAEHNRARWIERYEWHVDQIPKILEVLRDEAYSVKTTRWGLSAERISGGGGESPLPFRVDVIDDGDHLWAQLSDYVEDVAAVLDEPAPIARATSSTPVPWKPVFERVSWSRRIGRIQGLPAGLPGARAAAYGYVVIGWLCDRVEQIADLDIGDAEEILFGVIRRLRARYTAPAVTRRRRDCPICLEGKVTLQWVDVDGVSTQAAKCDRCRKTWDSTDQRDGAESPARDG